MGVGGVWMFLFYEVQEPAGGPLLAAQRRVDHCFLIVSFPDVRRGSNRGSRKVQ